jgi:hypothetical protein
MSTADSAHLANVFSIEVSFGFNDGPCPSARVVRDVVELVLKLLDLVCECARSESVELSPNLPFES